MTKERGGTTVEAKDRQNRLKKEKERQWKTKDRKNGLRKDKEQLRKPMTERMDEIERKKDS